MSMSSMMSGTMYQEEEIAKKSRDVSINLDGVKKIAEKVICEMTGKQGISDIGKKYFRHSNYFPAYHDHRSADWLFALNALNFSLIDPKSTNQWRVNGFTGYEALCYAMKRATTMKEFRWNPYYYTHIQLHEMKNIFLGDDGTYIPIIYRRRQILYNIGRILLDKYDGTFLTCIQLCHNDARRLMSLLTSEFDCYRDKVIYDGNKVCLNTKAKILINDLQFYYPIDATCVMTSTMFADIRSLQVFVTCKAIVFNENLKRKLQTNIFPVIQGSAQELEIRSCSIVAFKKVCEEVQKKITHMEENMINNKESFSIPILVDNILLRYRDNSNILCNIDTEQY